MAIKTAEAVEFKVGVETYSVRMGFHALCRIEEDLGVPFEQFIGQLQGKNGVRISHLLTIFHALMLGNAGDKPMENVTKAETAEIIDVLGVERVMEIIAAAIEASPLFKADENPVRGAGAKK